ncbi:MAG: peptidase C39 family protein [Candidatus Peregrinibacteria bacterium]
MPVSMVLRVPYFRQTKDYTCGPACVRMLMALHGKRLSEKHIARSVKTNRHTGTRKKEIVRFAKRRGFACSVNTRATWRDVSREIQRRMPVMVTYNEPSSDEGHYALVTGKRGRAVLLHDPWNGKHFRIPLPSFKRRWLGFETSSVEWGWMMTFIAPEERE